MLTPVKEAMLPVPEAASPIEVVLLVQLNAVEETVPDIFIAVTDDPAHTAWLLITSTVDLGLTVTVTVNVAPVQDPDLGVTV